MRESHTAILERNLRASGRWETEPYEVAWAREVIWFVYLSEPLAEDVRIVSQISADGQRWIDDEASVLATGADGAAVRLAHVGGWTRLVLDVPAHDADVRIDVYATAKE